MKTQGRGRGWALLVVAVSLAAGGAQAGEVQVTVRPGKNWIHISAGNLARAEGVRDGMVSFGFTLSYRWDSGAYIEAGTEQANDFDLFNFDVQNIDHHWLGGGWQFNLHEKWRLTPKLGMSYSALESSQAEFIDDGPTERLHAVVPFVELALERRFGRHFGLGVYSRHVFEEWGRTRGMGLTVAWMW